MNEVARFLLTAGIVSLPEVVARMRLAPKEIATALHELEERGMLEVRGEKDLHDFEQAVETVSEAAPPADRVRGHVLDRLRQAGRAFDHTTVHLSERGIRESLR